MLLSVVYGVYILFLSSPQQKAILNDVNDQKALKAFIIKVAEKMSTGLSKNQAYVLQKAETKWKQDPLIQIKPEVVEEKEESPQSEPVLATKIAYTGFLFFVNKRLAIINGM